MGLCKCPKRKVTNQFCFEHRVNVCEHCMVASHASCVVQSYLQWLQDSDYSPHCGFCNGPLAGDDCVRLVCYCLYHWSCLDQHCRSLPPSTAPAGYTCPGCSAPVFPPDNLVSPVADKLRSQLSEVNWARPGLGLPLLADSQERRPPQVPVGPRPAPEGEAVPSDPLALAHELVAAKAARETVVQGGTGWKAQETVVNFETGSSVRRGGAEAAQVARPLLTDPDSEGNKYKRRAPTDWLLRWWRSMTKPAAQRRRSLLHWALFLVAAGLAFFLLVVVFNHLGRGGNDDPMLDPMNNPNIRVADMM